MFKQKVLVELKPRPYQIIVCGILALAGFGILYGGSIFAKFVNPDSLKSSLSAPNATRLFFSVADSSLGHTVIIIIFWSLIGLLSYALVWGGTNTAIEAMNEATIELNFTNRGSASDRSMKLLIRVAFGLGLIGLFVLSGVLTLPLIMDGFAAFVVSDWHMALNFLWLVLYLVALATNLYTLWTALRISKHIV